MVNYLHKLEKLGIDRHDLRQAWVFTSGGETKPHFMGKLNLFNALIDKGYTADTEVTIKSETQARRADLVAWNDDKSKQIIFEIQRQKIDFEETYARTKHYFDLGLAVMWIGCLEEWRLDEEFKIGTGRYVIPLARPVNEWEKFSHALNFGELWYVDSDGFFYRGRFVPTWSYYSPGWHHFRRKGWKHFPNGWKCYEGGKRLYLTGPYSPIEIDISLKRRKAWAYDEFHKLPAGLIVKLRPEEDFNCDNDYDEAGYLWSHKSEQEPLIWFRHQRIPISKLTPEQLEELKRPRLNFFKSTA